MIGNLKPYPIYKPSGAEFLGDIPNHWTLRRMRTLVDMHVSNVDKHTREEEQPVKLCNYIDVYKNDLITDHIQFMRATATTDEIDQFKLMTGDVLITKDSESWNDIGVPALVDNMTEDIICGYHLAILRPHTELMGGSYLFRALQSLAVAYQYHVSANGVTRYGLSHNAIKSVIVPLPPKDEQATIVRYLDYMDRRIQRYIRAKQKLIALLNEQKQAIIHQAVTRGLDPNVKLKPSGVEWLGDIPEHWIVKPLKRWAMINRATLKEQTADDFTFHYIDIGTVGTGRLVREPEIIRFENAPSRARRILCKGDTIISTVRTYLKAIWYVEELNTEMIASTGFAVLSPYIEIEPEYLAYIIQSSSFIDCVSANSVGIAYPAIAETALGRFHLAMPPTRKEQSDLVDWIKASTASQARAQEHAYQEIEFLREYRTRLIADVVTGKVDVREIAAMLPDEEDEPELLSDEEVPAEYDEDTDNMDDMGEEDMA